MSIGLLLNSFVRVNSEFGHQATSGLFFLNYKEVSHLVASIHIISKIGVPSIIFHALLNGLLSRYVF